TRFMSAPSNRDSEAKVGGRQGHGGQAGAERTAPRGRDGGAEPQGGRAGGAALADREDPTAGRRWMPRADREPSRRPLEPDGRLKMQDAHEKQRRALEERLRAILGQHRIPDETEMPWLLNLSAQVAEDYE